MASCSLVADRDSLVERSNDTVGFCRIGAALGRKRQDHCHHAAAADDDDDDDNDDDDKESDCSVVVLLLLLLLLLCLPNF